MARNKIGEFEFFLLTDENYESNCNIPSPAQLQRDHISDSVPDVFNLDIGSLRNSITTASCSGDDEDIWLPGNNKRLSRKFNIVM